MENLARCFFLFKFEATHCIQSYPVHSSVTQTTSPRALPSIEACSGQGGNFAQREAGPAAGWGGGRGGGAGRGLRQGGREVQALVQLAP